MKTLLKILGVIVLLFVLVALGGYVWAGMATASERAKTFETHAVDFPIPFPIDAAEIAAMTLTPDAAQQLAQQRAVERGEHLIKSRYACTACHGANFGGGVMIDAFPIGTLLGPNVTLGTGSRTAGLSAPRLGSHRPPRRAEGRASGGDAVRRIPGHDRPGAVGHRVRTSDRCRR